MKKSHIIFGVERQCLWQQCFQSLSCTGHSDILRQRDLRVKAGWLFKGGDQESEASIERSDSAMEDIMFFFYQLDLGTRVQVGHDLMSVGFRGYTCLKKKGVI